MIFIWINCGCKEVRVLQKLHQNVWTGYICTCELVSFSKSAPTWCAWSKLRHLHQQRSGGNESPVYISELKLGHVWGPLGLTASVGVINVSPPFLWQRCSYWWWKSQCALAYHLKPSCLDAAKSQQFNQHAGQQPLDSDSLHLQHLVIILELA